MCCLKLLCLLIRLPLRFHLAYLENSVYDLIAYFNLGKFFLNDLEIRKMHQEISLTLFDYLDVLSLLKNLSLRFYLFEY